MESENNIFITLDLSLVSNNSTASSQDGIMSQQRMTTKNGREPLVSPGKNKNSGESPIKNMSSTKTNIRGKLGLLSLAIDELEENRKMNFAEAAGAKKIISRTRKKQGTIRKGGESGTYSSRV